MSRVEYRPANGKEISLYHQFVEERAYDEMVILLPSAGGCILWGPAYRGLMPEDQEWVRIVQRELQKNLTVREGR